jgi:collagenase-like PrtC family protease
MEILDSKTSPGVQEDNMNHMKYFSAPVDFKETTIDQYDELNKQYPDSRVTETYGNATLGECLESGRAVSQLPGVDLNRLADYVHYSRQKQIGFNYTVNAPYMQNREFTEAGVLKIRNFLTDLYEAGVRTLTVTLPSIAALVKSTGYDFHLKASAICSINNANKAAAYKKMGFRKIVVEQSINRDFHLLRRIVNRFGDNVEIIVNTPCHKDCTWRMMHYLQLSGDSLLETNEVSFNYYEHICMARRYEDIGNWLKLNWVRPEDLHYYKAIGINHFKLQGRQTVIKGGDFVRTLEYYFKEDYDGDLIELINLFAPMNTFKVSVDNKKLAGFIKPFVEKDNFCARDCPSCGYCDRFAGKNLDTEEAREVSRKAHQFYRQYDRYNKMLRSLKPRQPAFLENKMQDSGDFDF